MNRAFALRLVSVLSIAFLSGCSQAITLSNQANRTMFNVSEGLYPVPEQILNLSHLDGTIASLTPYTIKGQNPYIKLH